MKIEGASSMSFKIGWAFNWRRREREFNLSSLPQLGGLRYRTELKEFWRTAREAFKMEQAILQRFDHRRHPQNREVICGVPHEQLQSAWFDYLHGQRRRLRH